MSTTLTERARNLPLAGLPDARTLSVDATAKRVAAWQGITGWYSPASYEQGHWYDHLSGRESGRQFDNARETTAPGLVTIGGKQYVNLNGAARLVRFNDDAVLNTGAFSLMFVYHPNGDTNSGARYLLGAPTDALPFPDASNRFLSIWTIYFGGVRYWRLEIGGSSIIAPGTTFPNDVPVIVLVTYSAALGWRFRVIPPSGAGIDATLSGPTAGQKINRGGLALGDNYLAFGTAAYGALGDVLPFDRDLYAAANAATRTDAINLVTARWLA